MEDIIMICGSEIMCGLFEHYKSDKQRNYVMIHLYI